MPAIFRSYLAMMLTTFFFLTNGLFSPPHAAARQIIVNAVGDIMLAGKGTGTYTRMGYDYPFASLTDDLKNGDMAIGNLEAPITRHGKEFTGKKFRFKVNPAAAKALRRAGFSILTLANNHMMDYGEVGLEETLRHLDNAGILHTGAGSNLDAARKPALMLIGDKTIAFLAYSRTLPCEFYAGHDRAGTAPGVDSQYVEDISRAKSVADYVIVSFHWGAEKATIPRLYQIDAAHKAIDAGADVVIGHHPHVLQGIERYKNGVIFYSLGNFAFGSMSRSSDVSAIARVTLEDGIKELEVIPLNVCNREIKFQPRVLNGKGALNVINHLNQLSKQFGTKINPAGRHFLVVRTGER
ncbi:MAG TPA: CapA family protein [Geobacteraceae bacterium]|nr:CapA family protein [Geobacteraceae bacterium]